MNRLWLLALVVTPITLAHGGNQPRRQGKVVRWEKSRHQSVLVPAGPFLMGYAMSDSENQFAQAECLEEFGAIAPGACESIPSGPFKFFAAGSPARTVDLHAFEIDVYEVRVSDYRMCVTRGACDVAPLLSGDTRFLEDEWPMVNVTWQDATDYCKSVGRRLPTEAEWEKAARGKDGRRWPWGNELKKNAANHGKAESEAVTFTHGLLGPPGRQLDPEPEYVEDPSDGARYATAPGSYPAGASPYGAMDMAGNVQEWVQDYFFADNVDGKVSGGGYADLPTMSPVRSSPREQITHRVVRGGSWLTPLLLSRVYVREFAPPQVRSPLRGFRCARDVRKN